MSGPLTKLCFSKMVDCSFLAEKTEVSSRSLHSFLQRANLVANFDETMQRDLKGHLEILSKFICSLNFAKGKTKFFNARVALSANASIKWFRFRSMNEYERKQKV